MILTDPAKTVDAVVSASLRAKTRPEVRLVDGSDVPAAGCVVVGIYTVLKNQRFEPALGSMTNPFRFGMY